MDNEFLTDTGELDVDGIIEKYNEEHRQQEEPETEVTETETEPEEVTDEEPEEVTDEEPETQEEPDVPADEGEQTPPKEKRTPDQAFAEMRRQAEEYKKYAEWVTDLAKQQGFSDPDQLIEEFERQRIAKEAEANNIPVDVYEKLHRLEEENKEAKRIALENQFNQEVEITKNKYELSDEQLNEVFRFMGKNGYDIGTIPFEHAYLLANSENIIKEAKEKGRQEYLEEKREKQTKATPNVNTTTKDQTTKKSDGLDLSTEAIFAKFKEFDIPID